MKKLKLLILAFVIGTMNLFATNIFHNSDILIDSINDPIIIKDKDFKLPVKKLLADSKILSNNLINVSIIFTYNADGKIVIQEMQSEKYDLLISILENLKDERQISAIRDYAYEMPAIMRKE